MASHTTPIGGSNGSTTGIDSQQAQRAARSPDVDLANAPEPRPFDPSAFRSSPSAVKTREHRLRLDDLARMTGPELDRAYARGSVPASLSEVAGQLRGRCLALFGGGSGPTAAVRRFVAASPLFPWRGKNFVATPDPARGHGINRVFGLEWYAFDLRIEASRIDGKPAIVLDYDKPTNPWFIRKIHDEVRVVDGVLLGNAMWKTSRGARSVLHFGLELP